MQKYYETLVAYDATLAEETLAKQQESLQGFLEANGQFEKVDVWGRRELAYEINKKKIGHYCLFLFNGESSITKKLDEELEHNDTIIRYLTITRDPSKDKKDEVVEEAVAEPEAAAKEDDAPAEAVEAVPAEAESEKESAEEAPAESADSKEPAAE